MTFSRWFKEMTNMHLIKRRTSLIYATHDHHPNEIHQRLSLFYANLLIWQNRMNKTDE